MSKERRNLHCPLPVCSCLPAYSPLGSSTQANVVLRSRQGSGSSSVLYPSSVPEHCPLSSSPLALTQRLSPTQHMPGPGVGQQWARCGSSAYSSTYFQGSLRCCCACRSSTKAAGWRPWSPTARSSRRRCRTRSGPGTSPRPDGQTRSESVSLLEDTKQRVELTRREALKGVAWQRHGESQEQTSSLAQPSPV